MVIRLLFSFLSSSHTPTRNSRHTPTSRHFTLHLLRWRPRYTPFRYMQFPGLAVYGIRKKKKRKSSITICQTNICISMYGERTNTQRLAFLLPHTAQWAAGAPKRIMGTDNVRDDV